MTLCHRTTYGEGLAVPCGREAVYKGYCHGCAWVELPEEREMLPKRVKTVKRRKILETPWARRVFGRFTDWFTRKLWPVGSVLLRRNSNGMYDLPHGGKMPYGLGKGTADWIGFKSIVVTPEMVGKRMAVFLSVEAKREGIALYDRQKRWHEIVLENGGLSYRASPDNEEAVLLALSLEGHPGIPPS